MSSRAERLAETIERVQRARAESELAWLRRGRVDLDWIDEARRLLSPAGKAESEEALHERSWSRAEQMAFVAQRAELAFRVELAPAIPVLTKFASEPFALPFGSEELGPLIRGLWSDGNLEGRGHRGHALGEAATAIAPRLFELRSRALAARAEAAALELPAEVTPDDARPGLPPAPPAPPPRAATDLVELADRLLATTEDATRELTRWLVRPLSTGRTIPWHVLLRALRAPEFDGLARPARRFARVAQGLRGLGFERDLDARVRAERGGAMFDPRARVVAWSVPANLRIAQTTLDYGVMSDVYAAHGVGTSLAVALVSPALPSLLRRPAEPGAAETIGALSMQLRADREYLRRIDAIEPLQVERLARHAAVIVMLELRLQAALFRSEQVHVRTDAERVQQLTAALETALGVQLPTGLAALAGWASPPGGRAFEAALTGLSAHVGLRDRYDEDWYRNPRVSEVLRGAAARGATLAPAALADELGVSAEAGVGRSIELLG